MVAKITHGLKDFAQPFVVADVVADEECVTHVGTSFKLNGHALRAIKKASLPCQLNLNSVRTDCKSRSILLADHPSPYEVLATSHLAGVLLIRVNGARRPHHPKKRAQQSCSCRQLNVEQGCCRRKMH